ncbi:hypothetical protein SFRURICE_005005 [Spodoptera frugiperda]|nr:hypothetical protein SFRURICE_005005 [Spodoptera frugiperda]
MFEVNVIFKILPTSYLVNLIPQRLRATTEKFSKNRKKKNSNTMPDLGIEAKIPCPVVATTRPTK